MDGFTNQDTSSWQTNVVWCDLVMTLGTSGAVPASFTFGDGILNVVSGGSGVYTVTFRDGYAACLNIIENIVQASYSASGAVYFTWTTDNVGTATSTVVLTARTAAGAAVQPATGDKVYLSFRLKRTRL